MNDGVTQTGWFAYANTLTNPFSFNSDTEILKTSDELRDTDNVPNPGSFCFITAYFSNVSWQDS